jgi:hypothetical protein
MLSRSVSAFVGVFLLGLIVVRAGDGQQSWYGVEIVRFTDFDDVQVKLDGKEMKAFFAGLRPLRGEVRSRFGRSPRCRSPAL